jgi:hypothetical protein
VAISKALAARAPPKKLRRSVSNFIVGDYSTRKRNGEWKTCAGQELPPLHTAAVDVVETWDGIYSCAEDLIWPI